MAAVRIDGIATLANFGVLESDGDGIVMRDGSTPTLTNVTVAGARNLAYVLGSSARPIFNNVTSTRSGFDGVYLPASILQANYTWNFSGLPLYIDGTYFVGGGVTLTIAAGQTILFRTNGSYLNVSDRKSVV